jgi:hypothetical protein
MMENLATLSIMWFILVCLIILDLYPDEDA